MVTIAIQGILNDISLSNINIYRKFGKVILGVYTTDLDKLTKKYDCKIVKIPFPPPEGTNHRNIYYQSWSSFHILEKVKTEFVIKVRSDEKFTDLKPIIDKINKYPNKLITNNVGFTSTKHVAYHPSDHLIACNTDILKKTFQHIINTCQQNKNYNSNEHLIGNLLGINVHYKLSSEQVIFMSYLIAKYGIDGTNQILKMNMSDLMKQETDVVPFDDLGDIISSNSRDGEREYRNKEQLQCIYDNGPGCIPCIRSIEEV